jgi:8-demethyl-8-(2,3-dimethoxy-alpha-L-rhamnosyl)tetracenomycin-C 4'-O-methyltransferase
MQVEVEAAFERYGLLDSQVQFHKGFFNDSLPLVRRDFMAKRRGIALLRMDGDMCAPFA